MTISNTDGVANNALPMMSGTERSARSGVDAPGEASRAGWLRASGGDKLVRLLVEHISDVITIHDAQGTILYESPSFERVLGYKAAEFVGQNAFDLIHPDDAPQVFE